ncbi:hypothetical protein G6F59_016893 [Rhizopus arrhizus]|nr:hypothetical protein G6F59_016893 [Rhizopus arrhizus]
MSAGESAARAPAAACPWEAIVIGGSSGAIDALNTLLPALPAGLAAAVVVVLHLPRDRSSRIAEVLAPYCALPVREAEDKQPLQPGTVTFAPPDYHLLVEDPGTVALSVDAPRLPCSVRRYWHCC